MQRLGDVKGAQFTFVLSSLLRRRYGVLCKLLDWGARERDRSCAQIGGAHRAETRVGASTWGREDYYCMCTRDAFQGVGLFEAATAMVYEGDCSLGRGSWARREFDGIGRSRTLPSSHVDGIVRRLQHVWRVSQASPKKATTWARPNFGVGLARLTCLHNASSYAWQSCS